MLRCITAHHVPGFGDVPTGSLWADESPYVTDVELFEVVDDDPPPVVKAKPKVTRKFGQPAAAPTVEDED